MILKKFSALILGGSPEFYGQLEAVLSESGYQVAAFGLKPEADLVFVLDQSRATLSALKTLRAFSRLVIFISGKNRGVDEKIARKIRREYAGHDIRICRISESNDLKKASRLLIKSAFTSRPAVKIKKKPRARIFSGLAFFLILFILIILPPALSFAAVFQGYRKIMPAVNARFINQGENEKIIAARADFFKAGNIASPYLNLLSPLFPPQVNFAKKLLGLGQEAAETGLIAARTVQSLKNFPQALVLSGEISPENQLNDINDNLFLFNSRLNRLVDLAGELRTLSPTFFKALRLEKNLQIAAGLNESLKQDRMIFSRLSPVLPRLAGFDRPKHYLLLFQNNMELRATGGFIGSLALFSLSRGKASEPVFYDVYEADGRLKGHVAPPPAIARYLNQPHWYLRDSNFAPDFATAARQAEFFLEKELGVKVDGVIAMDLNMAGYLIDSYGGLELPDYQEKITGANLFIKAFKHHQDDFFSGSTGKKDFLSALVGRMSADFTLKRDLPWESLFFALKKGLNEKHLLFYFHDNSLQEVFENLGWSGRLAALQCQDSEPCLPDYNLIVDSNFGVNKSNYFVSRGISKEISAGGGAVKSQLTIVYRNQSPKGAGFAGQYKNYLRLYFPAYARLTELSVDGSALNDQEAEINFAGDKQEAGLWIVVPEGRERIVALSYDLPVLAHPAGVYQLLFQKQPGTAEDELSVNFYDLAGGQPVVYNTDLAVDRIFKFKRQN